MKYSSKKIEWIITGIILLTYTIFVYRFLSQNLYYLENLNLNYYEIAILFIPLLGTIFLIFSDNKTVHRRINCALLLFYFGLFSISHTIINSTKKQLMSDSQTNAIKNVNNEISKSKRSNLLLEKRIDKIEKKYYNKREK